MKSVVVTVDTQVAMQLPVWIFFSRMCQEKIKELKNKLEQLEKSMFRSS